MSTIGVIKPLRWDRDFTIVPNEFGRDHAVSPLAKSMILDIQGRPEDWQTTVPGIMSITGWGRDKARAAIVDGEDAGYIYKHTARDAKKRIVGVEYIVSACKKSLRGYVVEQGWEASEYLETGISAAQAKQRKKDLAPETPGPSFSGTDSADLGPGSPRPGVSGPITNKEGKRLSAEPAAAPSQITNTEQAADSHNAQAREVKVKTVPVPVQEKAPPRRRIASNLFEAAAPADRPGPGRERQTRYTPEFEAFWKAVPKAATSEKRKAAQAWSLIPAEDRVDIADILPAYRDAIATAGAAQKPPRSLEDQLNFEPRTWRWLDSAGFETFFDQLPAIRAERVPGFPPEVKRSSLVSALKHWHRDKNARAWAVGGYHSAYGPPPGEDGCRIPANLVDLASRQYERERRETWLRTLQMRMVDDSLPEFAKRIFLSTGLNRNFLRETMGPLPDEPGCLYPPELLEAIECFRQKHEDKERAEQLAKEEQAAAEQREIERFRAETGIEFRPESDSAKLVNFDVATQLFPGVSAAVLAKAVERTGRLQLYSSEDFLQYARQFVNEMLQEPAFTGASA
jgi:hypothetical protein